MPITRCLIGASGRRKEDAFNLKSFSFDTHVEQKASPFFKDAENWWGKAGTTFSVIPA
jgi:hypothetical protein